MALKQRPQRLPFSQNYQNIIKSTHLIKESNLLESAGNVIDFIFPWDNFFSFSFRKQYYSFIMRKKTGKQIDKRGFTATVWTKQASNKSFSNSNRKMVYGVYSAEMFYQLFCFKNIHNL